MKRINIDRLIGLSLINIEFVYKDLDGDTGLTFDLLSIILEKYEQQYHRCLFGATILNNFIGISIFYMNFIIFDKDDNK